MTQKTLTYTFHFFFRGGGAFVLDPICFYNKLTRIDSLIYLTIPLCYRYCWNPVELRWLKLEGTCQNVLRVIGSLSHRNYVISEIKKIGFDP